MRYADMDHTYLAQAVRRISEGLQLATKIPVEIEPPEETISALKTSMWIVYVTSATNADSSNADGTQTWLVTSELIYKRLQQQRDATIYTASHVLVTQALNFLQGRKRLIMKADQAVVPYLRPTLVSVTLDRINSGGQPGFAIVHRLPFHISIDQQED